MTKYSDPEWVSEKLCGEEPLDMHTCHFCAIKSTHLILINHGDKQFHSCAESYNSWLYDLHYPDPVPTDLIQDESYPCYQSLDEPF